MLQPSIESCGWFCNSQRHAQEAIRHGADRLGPLAEQGLASVVGLLEADPAGEDARDQPLLVHRFGLLARLADLQARLAQLSLQHGLDAVFLLPQVGQESVQAGVREFVLYFVAVLLVG